MSDGSNVRDIWPVCPCCDYQVLPWQAAAWGGDVIHRECAERMTFKREVADMDKLKFGRITFEGKSADVAVNRDAPWLTRLSMPGAKRDEVCELHAMTREGGLGVAVAVYPSGTATFDWELIEYTASNPNSGPLGFLFKALIAARGSRS